MNTSNAAAGPSGPDVDEGGWTLRLVLSTIFLALVIEAMTLGASMASIGLPSILQEFPTDQGGWVVSTYFLSGAVAAPLLGKAADLYGKRRILLITLFLSGIGALLCAIAPSFGVLLVGRALQGLVMATISLSYSLIRDVYPKRPAAFAVSVTSAGIGVFSIVNPLLVGWLIATWGFRGMFWFDVIWTFGLLFAVMLSTPESSLRRKARPDVLGGTLLSLGVLSVLIYVSMGREWGWTSALGLGLVVFGVLMLVFFVAHARRAEEPIANLQLITRRPLVFTILTGAIGYALAATTGQAMVLLAVTPREAGKTYGLGMTTIEYAQIGSTQGVATVVAGVLLGMLVARGRNPRFFMLLGMIAWSAGTLLLALSHNTLFNLITAALVYGFGIGFVQAAIPNLVIRSVPARDQGSTAGTVQMFQTGTGAALPVVMFAVMAPYATINPAGGVIYAEQGLQLWLLISSGLALLAFLLGVTVLRERPGDVPMGDVVPAGATASAGATRDA